jgi:hypothetical protein
MKRARDEEAVARAEEQIRTLQQRLHQAHRQWETAHEARRRRDWDARRVRATSLPPQLAARLVADSKQAWYKRESVDLETRKWVKHACDDRGNGCPLSNDGDYNYCTDALYIYESADGLVRIDLCQGCFKEKDIVYDAFAPLEKKGQRVLIDLEAIEETARGALAERDDYEEAWAQRH